MRRYSTKPPNKRLKPPSCLRKRVHFKVTLLTHAVKPNMKVPSSDLTRAQLTTLNRIRIWNILYYY